MKKRLLLTTATLAATIVAAQNPTACFMEGSTFRPQFNPAFAPRRGYVKIPALGGIDIAADGNFAPGDTFLFRSGKPATLLGATASIAEALAGLRPQHDPSTDVRIDLLGFGAYARDAKRFWSFDLAVRTTAQIALPRPLSELLENQRRVRIEDIGISATAYLEAAFAYSFPLLDERLYMGIRGKLLAGAAYVRLNYDRLDISLEGDRRSIEARATLDITAGRLGIATADSRFGIGELDAVPAKPVGYGCAVDLGALYDLLPDLQVSLAVNDLGFIVWSKKHTLSGIAVNSLEFTDAAIPGDGTPPLDLAYDDALHFERTDAGNASRMLHASIDAAVEYSVWRRKLRIGLLYTSRLRTYGTLHDLTGAIDIRPIRWLGLTGSYSVSAGRGGTLGAGLNICPGWIDLLVAADIPTTGYTVRSMPFARNSIHLTFGLGVPIGRHGARTTKRYMQPLAAP